VFGACGEGEMKKCSEAWRSVRANTEMEDVWVGSLKEGGERGKLNMKGQTKLLTW